MPRDIDDINLCHECLHDAYAASLAVDAAWWELSHAETTDPVVVRARHLLRVASLALSKSVEPWSERLGPKDKGGAA